MKFYEFLHALDLREFGSLRSNLGFPEFAHVGQDFAARRQGGRFPSGALADLPEEPRIANGAAADHQTSRSGLGQDFKSLIRSVDVSVGQAQDSSGYGPHGYDKIVTDARSVHLRHRPPVDSEQVNGMMRENPEQLVESAR